MFHIYWFSLKVTKGRPLEQSGFVLMWIDLQLFELWSSGGSIRASAAQDCSCFSIFVCSERCAALFNTNLERNPPRRRQRNRVREKLSRLWSLLVMMVYLTGPSFTTHLGIRSRISAWVWCRQGLKLTLAKSQMLVKINAGEGMKQCYSPVGWYLRTQYGLEWL